MRALLQSAAIAALLVPLGGCDKLSGSLDDAKKAVTDKVTSAVDTTTETVKQSVGGAGEIAFTVDAPVKTSGCYASLFVFSDGRPSLVQITSYHDASSESFPSVFLQAETGAKSPAELTGKSLEASLYTQAERDGPVWQSAEGAPVTLTIGEATAHGFKASFQGSVESSKSEKKEVTGDLQGSFKAK